MARNPAAQEPSHLARREGTQSDRTDRPCVLRPPHRQRRNTPTLALAILSYAKTPELLDLLRECIKSYAGKADALIICEDGGLKLPWADLGSHQETALYCWLPENRGFTRNANIALHTALRLNEEYLGKPSPDYVAVVNSDTTWISGDLHDLCIPGKVTSPEVDYNPDWPWLNGSFFCVPRSVVEDRGYLDERFKMAWSDKDYGRRVEDIFQKVDSVKIHHPSYVTIEAVFGREAYTAQYHEGDGERYRSKWGSLSVHEPTAEPVTLQDILAKG
jgi:hypothetical protein